MLHNTIFKSTVEKILTRKIQPWVEMDNDCYDFHSPVFKEVISFPSFLSFFFFFFLKGMFLRMFCSIKFCELCEAIELKCF